MVRRLLRLVCVCITLVMAAGLAPASAQSQPPGWTKQDMDRFVDAVSDAVARKLTEQGKAAPAKAAAGAGPATDGGGASANHVLTRIGEIAGNLPGLLRHVGELPTLLDKSGTGGIGFWGFLLRISLIAALALGAEWAARLATSRLVNRLSEHMTAPPPWPRWLALTAVEAAALGAFALVGNAVFASLFLGASEQGGIANALLMALFRWRAILSVLRCWLRPLLPAARLAPVSDGDAAAILRSVAIAAGIAATSRAFAGLLAATGATRDELLIQQFIGTPIVIGGFIYAVLALKGPIGRWLEELMAIRSRESWDHFIASHWHFGGVAFYLGLAVAVFHGGISGRVDLPTALNDLQLLMVAWLLAETVLYCIHKRRMQARAAVAAEGPHLVDIGWRGLDIVVRIVVGIVMARIVATEILDIVPLSAWAGYAAQLASVGFVVFAAWVIWQAAKYYFEVVAGPARGPVLPGSEDSEGDEDKLEGASRLRTLVPVLRTIIFVLVVSFTALIVLSQLGVNITPILAGASIFGLALSFGSQSLVRDIVSGVFFLADDAFRVGEYIDIGKAKGTVESFTLRSIRLRHQGGQIHTIPFGQLGQITNFSRDYATVKFNLRFARDTDVEALRKAAKKIGQELLEDPDIKDDFLVPLKLQGIADIQDNALIARFKFTVRPGRPSFIQRLAVKRMLQVFPERGIEFASATVAVRSIDGVAASPEAAAAISRGIANANAAAAGA